MAGTVRPTPFRDHAFAWALAISIVAHALFSLAANPFHFATEKFQLPIKVDLLPPPKPEPPPEAIKPPEPPKPVPPPPNPKPRPQPKPPKPVEPPKVIPEPVPAPEPTPVEAPQISEPPPVVAVAPTAEEAPAFTAPPPPEPVGPTPKEIDTAKSDYGSLLARTFAKYKQYPRLARMRGWQGTAKVKLDVGTDGNIIATVISESSGYEILDRQALEMVKKASPLPRPPEQLRNQPFTVIVPIVFRLE